MSFKTLQTTKVYSESQQVHVLAPESLGQPYKAVVRFSNPIATMIVRDKFEDSVIDGTGIKVKARIPQHISHQVQSRFSFDVIAAEKRMVG